MDTSTASFLPQSSTAIEISPGSKERNKLPSPCTYETSNINDCKRKSTGNSSIFGRVSVISSSVAAENNHNENYEMAYMVVTSPDKNKKLQNVEIIEKQLSEFPRLKEENKKNSETDLNLEPPPLDEDGIIEGDGDSDVEQDNNRSPSYWLRKRIHHKVGGLFPSNPDILFDWISDESPENSCEEAETLDSSSTAQSFKSKSSSNEKIFNHKPSKLHVNPKYHETETALSIENKTTCSSHFRNERREIISKSSDNCDHVDGNESTPKSNSSRIPLSDFVCPSDASGNNYDTEKESYQHTEEFSKIHSDGLKIVLKRTEIIKAKQITKPNHLETKLMKTSTTKALSPSLDTPTKTTTERTTNPSSKSKETWEELLLTDSKVVHESRLEAAVETIEINAENMNKVSVAVATKHNEKASITENCKSACGSAPPICDEITQAESCSVETKKQCSKKKLKKKDKAKESPSNSANSHQSSSEASDTGMRLSMEFIHHNWLERQLIDKMRLKENDQKKNGDAMESDLYKEDRKSNSFVEEVKEATVNSSISNFQEEGTPSSNTCLVAPTSNIITDTAQHNVIGIVKPFQRYNKSTTEHNRLAPAEEKLKITSVPQNIDAEIVKDAIKLSSEKNLTEDAEGSLKPAKDILPEVEKYYSLAVYPVRRNGQAWDLTSKDKIESSQLCGALDLSKKVSKMTTPDHKEVKSRNHEQDLLSQLEKEYSTKSKTAVESPKSLTTKDMSNTTQSKPFVVFSTVSSSTKSSYSSMAPRTNGNLSNISSLEKKTSTNTKDNKRKHSFDENKLYDIVRMRSNESDAITLQSNGNAPTFQSQTSYKAQEVTRSSSFMSGSEMQQKAPILLSIAPDPNRATLLHSTSTSSLSSPTEKKISPNQCRRASSETKTPSISSSSAENIVIDVEAFDDHIEDIRPRSSQKKRMSPFRSSTYKLNSTSTPRFTQTRRFSQSATSPSQATLQTKTPPSLNGLFKEVEKEVQRQGYSHFSSEGSFRKTTMKETMHPLNHFRQQISPKVNEAPSNGISQVRAESSNSLAPKKVALENTNRVGPQRVGNINPQLFAQHNDGTSVHRNNPTAPLLSPHSADLQRNQRNANLLRQPVKPRVSGYVKVGACGAVAQYPSSSPIQRHAEPMVVQADALNQQYKSPIKPTPVRTQQVQYAPRINRFPVGSDTYQPRSHERTTEHLSGAVGVSVAANRSPSRLIAFSNGFYMPRPPVVRAPPGGVSINSTPIFQSKHNFPTPALPRPVLSHKEVKRIPEIPAGHANPPGLDAMSNEEAARFAAHLNAQKVELENQIRKLEMLENKIYAPRRAPETSTVKHPSQDPAYAGFLEARKRKASSSQYPPLPPHHNLKMLSSYNSHQPPPRKVMHTMFSPNPQGAIERNRGLGVDEKCGVCRKKAFFVCSGCRGIWYCSKNCQFEDWTKHSQTCS